MQFIKHFLSLHSIPPMQVAIGKTLLSEKQSSTVAHPAIGSQIPSEAQNISASRPD
jgi:hypothetical protein